MDTKISSEWDTLSPDTKKKVLYERQKALLVTFREHNAISQADFAASLQYLNENPGLTKTESAKREKTLRGIINE